MRIIRSPAVPSCSSGKRKARRGAKGIEGHGDIGETAGTADGNQ